LLRWGKKGTPGSCYFFVRNRVHMREWTVWPPHSTSAPTCFCLSVKGARECYLQVGLQFHPRGEDTNLVLCPEFCARNILRENRTLSGMEQRKSAPPMQVATHVYTRLERRSPPLRCHLSCIERCDATVAPCMTQIVVRLQSPPD